MAVLIDSNSTITTDQTIYDLYSGSTNVVGQSFTADGTKIAGMSPA